MPEFDPDMLPLSEVVLDVDELSVPFNEPLLSDDMAELPLSDDVEPDAPLFEDIVPPDVPVSEEAEPAVLPVSELMLPELSDDILPEALLSDDIVPDELPLSEDIEPPFMDILDKASFCPDASIARKSEHVNEAVPLAAKAGADMMPTSMVVARSFFMVSLQCGSSLEGEIASLAKRVVHEGRNGGA